MANVELLGATSVPYSKATLVPGTNLAITEAPAGTFTLDASGGGGGASITQTISIGDVIAGSGVNNFILTAIAPTTGFYQVSANIKFAVVPAADSDVYISIFDSTGAAEIASQWLPILLASFPNALPIQLNCSTGFQCNAGNIFNVNVKITAAAGATTTADILTNLTLLLVG